MKVLIVEDDKKLALTYRNILSSIFDIMISENLRDVKRVIKSEKIDVVLLDIMLPDGLGYEIIPFIKNESNAIVIIISALEKEETRRIAYKKGADDYMIKPVTLFELEYKLKAINKRKYNESPVYRIGDLILNLENSTLSTDYNSIIIQNSQGIVLKMLFEKYKKGDILYKTELSGLKEIKKIHDFRVHTLISRLRKTIKELESDKVIIENVYGKGYRLVVMK
ncbi:MAG: response regulator transcription factor [Maledivibacter sp.]|jgi:DNA-binding response OmpR family regulator|nr:response regulator transcription factor [Maledivibacter sp.]